MKALSEIKKVYGSESDDVFRGLVVYVHYGVDAYYDRPSRLNKYQVKEAHMNNIAKFVQSNDLSKTDYDRRYKSILNSLNVIKSQLIVHKRNFNKNPNWGYVGELGTLDEDLKERAKFLR